MIKQTTKIFSTSTTNHIHPPIDKQINEYLELHEDYRIVTVSYMVAGMMEKALVVFSYQENEQRSFDESHDPKIIKSNGGKRA